MPNVDNLNFKVIIDDAQFNQKIKAMERMAKDFNTSLSSLLNVKAISQELVVSNRKRNQMETDNVRAIERQNREKMKTEALERKLNASVEKTSKGYMAQSRILQDLKGLALGYLSVQGAGQLLSSLVRVTGEFEMQKTTLAAMLGDLNTAEQVITRIQGLAVESPFQFKELTTYAKQLSAFSVPAQELYDTTKMLADVSAGLGVGMDRLVLAYGQVRSAAFLRGQEVRQFTEAGIPILDELAKQFSELEGRVVSTTEVFDKISKRLVPFEMVSKVFKDMTSEGGKFFNMQEVQAETLRGKISNLKDAYEVMLNEIGQTQTEKLKGAVDWARKLMTNYEETGRILLELVTAYGIYKAALIATEVATKSFDVANHKLIGSLVNVAKYIATNPYALIAAGITALGYAIYRNHKQLEGYQKVQKAVADIQSDFTKDTSKEIAKLDALYAKLRLAKEGTEDYYEARKEIFSQYSGYISELKAEGVEVDNLAGIYENLKTKIEDATRARTSAKAKQKLTETYDQEIDSIYDRYIDIITKAQKQLDRQVKNAGGEGYRVFNEFEKAGFWKFITGSMNMGDLERTTGLERVVSVLKNATIDASADLKLLRKEMVATTKEYNKSLREIKMAYGEVKEGADGITPLGGGDGTQEVIDSIQKEISALQTLKKEYDEFKSLGISDEAITLNLQNFFPNIESAYGEDFITQLNYATRILEKVKELEQIAPEEAYDLMTSLGIDKASLEKQIIKERIQGYNNMADAATKYYETIRKWAAEDFNLDGEGVMLDVSKIVSDLNSKFNDIDLRAKKTKEILSQVGVDDQGNLPAEAIERIKREFESKFGVGSWDLFYKEYVSEGEKAIDTLAEKEKQYEKQLAEERARDLAQKYVSEKMLEMNIDLSEFDSKTVSQIETQLDRLKELSAETQAKINTLKVGGIAEDEQLAINALESALKILGIKIGDTGVALEEKIFDRFKEGISAVSTMTSKVAELGKAIGNDELARFGEQFSDAADNISKIAEAAKAKDTIAIIANALSFIIDNITATFTAAYEHQVALNEATKQYTERLNEARRAAHSGIFGTDELALAAENTEILSEATKKYEESLRALNNPGLMIKKRYNSIDFKTSVSEILGDIANSDGWELYKKNGELNLDAIESHFESYKKSLTKKQRQIVEDLIDSGKAYEDAAAQQAQYLTELYGQVADTIANNMVDAFIESGDAAINMGEMVSNIAKSMAADLIKNLYILPILNKYEEQAKEIEASTSLTPSQKVEAELDLLDRAMSEVAGKSDEINAALDRVSQYFEKGETEGTTAMGEGINGMTENTANLLASYLNAIRADVAYSKTLWQRMDANTQAIATALMGFSAPSLMEYQAKIEANTYNNMLATQAILSRLDSVLVYGNEGEAIRVYKDN
jgi:hypothetical protein